MSFLQSFRRRRPAQRSQPRRARRLFEPLEDRRVLANLEITSLTTNNASLAEHNFVTGDDRGAIAISDTAVFYTGDSSTGAFPVNSVGSGTSTGFLYDALVSDVGSGVVYSLGSSPTTPLPGGGGTVTHLIELDGATGAQVGSSVALSSSVSIFNGAGIFAGNAKVVLWDANTGVASAIDTSTGAVTTLGTVFISMNGTENWARWGVAEEFGGDDYLTYLNGSSVVRTRISDGATSTVASFPAGLSDMAVFTVSDTLQRWYFHYEGFAGAFGFGNDETIGYADAVIKTGLTVVSSDPADGGAVVSPPTDFVLDFSDAYDPASVVPGDLTVNGTPADFVQQTDANTLAFRYTISPVTAEGLQTMHMAAGAITSLIDGDPVEEFTAGFFYDTLALAVTATTPADGTLATLPLTTLLVDFNEPVAAASVDVADVSLSLGTVTAAALLDADTAEYTLSGVLDEGQLSFALAAGAVTDVFGNPSQEYDGSILLDRGIVPFPTPLSPVMPPGSLISDGLVSGLMNGPGDTDTYTLDVDAGAMIALAVVGQSSSGTQTAVPTGSLWRYLDDGSDQENDWRFLELDDSTWAQGPAQLGYGEGDEFTVVGFGPDNNNKHITTYFRHVFSLSDVATFTSATLALLRDDGASVYINGVEVIRDLLPGALGDNSVAFNTLATVIAPDDGQGFTFWTIDPAVFVEGDNLLAVEIHQQNGNSSDISFDLQLEIAFDSGSLQPRVELRDSADNLLAFGEASTAGESAVVQATAVAGGSYRLVVSQLGDTVGPYTLFATVNADLETEAHGGAANDSLATAQSLEASFIPLLGDASRGAVVGFGDGASSDLYSLSLAAGDTLSVALTSLPFGNLTVELLDATGTPLAASMAVDTNVSQAISSFGVAASGDYYLEVSGDTTYSLVVVRNADFDTENNGGATSAQDLHAAGVALGHLIGITPLPNEFEPNDDGQLGIGPVDLLFANDLSGNFAPLGGNVYQAVVDGMIASGNNVDWDFFKFFARPGDNLLAAMDGLTLGDSFVYIFDQFLNFLAFDDNSGGNGNALLNFNSFFYDGPYYLVADSNISDTGSYRLTATLTTPELRQSADSDSYVVQAQAGDLLEVSTLVPFSGPGEPVNELDLAVTLYDPSGAPVGGPAGAISHTAASSGTYRVELVAENGTSGDYAVQIGGHSGAPPLFTVESSFPVDGAVVTDPPTEVTIDFSDPVLLTSLTAADLTVDGVAAIGLTIFDGDTAIFTLPAGLANGTHVLALASGSVTSVAGEPLVGWTASFRLDQTGPRVVASSIVENQTFAAGPFTYTATFDEPLASDNFSSDDVVIVGQLSGAILPTTVSYIPATATLQLDFANLPDDSYTLTLLSGDGRFEDVLGNDLDGEVNPATTVPSGDGVPGGDFVLHFSADHVVSPYPTPLVAKDPLGSLIYDPEVSGSIGVPDDLDEFTLAVDGGQTITILVDPNSTLRPTILLDGTPQATAPVAGIDLVRQTVPLSAGLHTIGVAGAGGTTGAYTLQLVLNAALEEEEHGGLDNDTLPLAQDLNPSTIALPGGARRGAVLGRSDGPPIFRASQTQTGVVFFPNVLTFTLTNLATPLAGGTLTLSAIADLDFTEEFIHIQAEGIDLGNYFFEGGNQYPAVPDVESKPLTLAQLQQLTADGTITIVATPSQEMNDFGPSSLEVAIEYQVGESPDLYSISLASGDYLSAALARPGSFSNKLRVLDSSGTILAEAVAGNGANVGQIFNRFRAPAPGTYYLSVDGPVVGQYSLTFTHQADFDRENNSTADTAQDITGVGRALGYVQGDAAQLADEDWYRFEVNSGDSLRLETSTPGDGPFEPVNTLDPAIELFGPDGLPVGSDQNGAADGRNAVLLHQATQSGAYRARVVGEAASAGEYFVQVSGATGALTGPVVINTDPDDGAKLVDFPLTYTLDFSEALLLDSADANELRVDGIAATNVLVVDGDSLVFTLNPAAYHGPDTYQVTLTLGAVLGVTGEPNQPFTATFQVDATGPQVVATQWNGQPLPADKTLPLGALDFTAYFSEELDATPAGGFLVQLIDLDTGLGYQPTSVVYTPGGSLIVPSIAAHFDALPEGRFALRLVSGDGTFEDAVGNDLDGEPLGAGLDGTPSGDGTRGGDYTISFSVDAIAARAVGPFERLAPLGSLVSASAGQAGLLNSAIDSDEFTLNVLAGQTIAAVLTPNSAAPVLTAQFVGLGSAVTASGPGRSIVVGPLTVPADGPLSLLVSGDAQANYHIELTRNAALEAAAGDTGEGVELSIDDSHLQLGSGRYAVLGSTSDTTYVRRDSAWRYLDSGSDQGTAWRSPTFDDSLWPIGNAQFGYGDFDETTTLRELNDQGGRIRTFYFRHSFFVENPAAAEDLGIGLLRDDGAVVYLNGTEILRSNMPNGAIGFQTLANVTVDNAAENEFASFTVPAAQLVAGHNVVAVEVHQVNDNSSDVSFNFEMGGVAGQQIILPAGSVWKYLDNNSNQGTAWQAPGFNDTAWAQGPAELGYGDGGEATIVNGGPNNNRFITTYFRRTFSIANPAEFSSLVLELVRDDGAVVYLNGTEVVRSNLDTFYAPNQVPFDALALSSISGGAESAFNTFPVSASLLVPGDNVLAVEIHQNATNSSDISFNLRLRGIIAALDADDYTVDLTAGQPIDVILAGLEGADFSGQTLELIAPDGFTVLATASDSPLGVHAPNYTLGIFDYAVPADGAYLVRVTSRINGRYSLVVTDSLVFDSEPNDLDVDPLRNLQGAGAALGYLATAALVPGGIEPDDYPAGTVLDTVHPNVVLSENFSGGNVFAFDFFASPTGTRVFGSNNGGVGWGGSAVLRASFASPVDEVSLDAGADDEFDVSALQAFDSNNTLLAEVISPGISSGQSFTMSIVRPTADIAYVLAFGVGGEISMLDNLRFNVAEPDLVDRYTLGNLAAGETLLLTTDTPDAAGADPANDLDPGLRVLDAVGNVVATSSDGAADGKNVRLLFAAPQAGQYTVEVAAQAGSGEYVLRASEAAAVVARHVFYNNSKFDLNLPAANGADSFAIAPDKSALLPGETGSFSNYTSYSRGLNGIMVDIAGLPGTPTAGDFDFRVGNDNNPAGWSAAPAPTSITVRPGEGANGSDRVTIIWPDFVYGDPSTHAVSIHGQWLQVTVLANANTGLLAPDVFSFGNAPGEVGNSPKNAQVNSADEALIRLNGRSQLNPAPIDYIYDINRDGLANAADQVISRLNSTSALTALSLIAPPVGAAPLAGSAVAAASDLALLADADLSSETVSLLAHEVARRRRTN